MAQILEIALIDGVDKESDLPQPSFVNTHVDSLLAFAAGDSNIDLVGNIRCMLQGIDVVMLQISPSVFYLFFLFFNFS